MFTKSIPAIPYLATVKAYAIGRGLPVLTWTDWMIARRLYEQYAAEAN